jgi:hypothetical protein
MDRWVANTLRTLGIVLLGGFILLTCLVLLVCSMCAWGGGFGGGNHPDQGVKFLIAAVVVLVGGIWIIARLARSLIADAAAGQTVAPVDSEPSVPFHLSPSGLRAIHLLAGAMGAQIVLSAAGLFWNQYYFWRTTQSLPLHNWTLILLAPFVLYHVPYAILIHRLLRQPDRRAFAYSLAVPSVLVLQSLLTLSLVVSVYVRHPVGLLLLAVPWLIHFVILGLAYKAIQIVGLHPEPPLLIRAGLITFAYFFFLHIATPLMYLLSWRSHG